MAARRGRVRAGSEPPALAKPLEPVAQHDADRVSKQSLPPQLTDAYAVGATIGEGGYAKVKLGYHKLTGEKVALKIIDKRAMDRKGDLMRVERELVAHMAACHVNIARLYQVIDTPNKLYLVMEHCPNGELFDYIITRGRATDSEARRFFCQLILAVACCHHHGFAHRDLKPENLMLNDNYQLKLIDFGLVGHAFDPLCETSCGSLSYAAPEVIHGVPYRGTAADVWSLGVVLHALLCGYLPFDDENPAVQVDLITVAQLTLPSFIKPGAEALLRWMLQASPDQRPTLHDLVCHSWFVDDEEVPELAAEYRAIRDEFMSGRLFGMYQKPQSLADLDAEVVTSLSGYYGVSEQIVTARLVDWKYDHVVADYELLLKRKHRSGVLPRLPPQKGALEPPGGPVSVVQPSRSSRSSADSAEIANLSALIEHVTIPEEDDGPEAEAEAAAAASAAAAGASASAAPESPQRHRYASDMPSPARSTSPRTNTKRTRRRGATLDSSLGQKHAAALAAANAVVPPPSDGPRRSSSWRSIAFSVMRRFTGSQVDLSKPRGVSNLSHVAPGSLTQAPPDELADALYATFNALGAVDVSRDRFIVTARFLQAAAFSSAHQDVGRPGLQVRQKQHLTLSAEVCTVDFLCGIQFRRIKGDAWFFNHQVAAILDKIKENVPLVPPEL